MITPQQVVLVKETWSHVTPVSNEMGTQFYDTLFAEYPELKPLFKSAPKDQAMKLMFMLSYLVHRLDNQVELKEEITKLAQRHKNYQAKPEHYVWVGKVLLSTLKNQLGNKWTAETAQAWEEAYALISGLMIENQN